MEIEIKHKIWIESNGELLMGRGHAELLQALLSDPSLSRATKKVKISYSKAGKLMKLFNEKAEKPAMIMAPGGKQGGKTTVTPFGHKLLNHYLKTHQKYLTFLTEEVNQSHPTDD